MIASSPKILPYGDCAFLIEFGNQIDRSVSERILHLNEELLKSNFTGLVETLPTFRSLLVKYDPLQTGFETLSAEIEGLLTLATRPATSHRRWHVPVCYEEDYAPDLAYVADAANVSPTRVIDLHIKTEFHVYMIGFVAGYAYLGDLPQELSLPRRADPRVRVPAGSIAIALTMAAIYPVVSPGGWHLIGRTPIRIFDTSFNRPALFTPGDKIEFRPMNAKQYKALDDAIQHDNYQIEPESLA